MFFHHAYSLGKLIKTLMKILSIKLEIESFSMFHDWTPFNMTSILKYITLDVARGGGKSQEVTSQPFNVKHILSRKKLFILADDIF